MNQRERQQRIHDTRPSFFGAPGYYTDPRVDQETRAEQVDQVFDGLSWLQRKSTQAVTGEDQFPSEAMGIENPWGAMAVDAVLDPLNIPIGAAASRIGQAGRIAKGRIARTARARGAVNTSPTEAPLTPKSRIDFNQRVEQRPPLNFKQDVPQGGNLADDIDIGRMPDGEVMPTNFKQNIPAGRDLAQRQFDELIERVQTPEGMRRAQNLGIDPQLLTSQQPTLVPAGIDGPYVRPSIRGNVDFRVGAEFWEANPHIPRFAARSEIGFPPYSNQTARITNRHELEHVVQSAAKISEANVLYPLQSRPPREFISENIPIKTKIDDMLQKLEVDNTVQARGTYDKYYRLRELEEVAGQPGQADRAGRYSEMNIHPNSRRYFDTEATPMRASERSPFVAELQQFMVDDGIIRHQYDVITPQHVKRAAQNAKQSEAGEGLRIFHIMKHNDKNYQLLSETLNMMLQHPGTIMGAGVGAAGAASVFEQFPPSQ